MADQRADPDSMLHETRRLIALKKRLSGRYEPLPAEDGHWRFRRGDVVVDLDFDGSRVSIDG